MTKSRVAPVQGLPMILFCSMRVAPIVQRRQSLSKPCQSLREVVICSLTILWVDIAIVRSATQVCHIELNCQTKQTWNRALGSVWLTKLSRKCTIAVAVATLKGPEIWSRQEAANWEFQRKYFPTSPSRWCYPEATWARSCPWHSQWKWPNHVAVLKWKVLLL